MNLTRCARPTIGASSSYTVLGFLGYGVAVIVAVLLAQRWRLPLEDRLIVMIVPPTAFLLVVALATAVAGRERIVFYQTALGAAASVTLAGFVLGSNVWRVLDITVLGIGIFLVFGRIGCFTVACCHGRPARHGVRYGAAHVAAGFWPRWSGRTLFPIQLVESAASLVLVVTGLALSSEPGRAAIVYAAGYALLRFGLELLRGDPIRPFARGLSEAQWTSIGVSLVLAFVWPAWWTYVAAGVLLLAATTLVTRRRQRELVLAPHLHALDAACIAVLADPQHARRDTALGVGVSCHYLEDGRVDWVLSSNHARWSAAIARRIAVALWHEPELVEGRTAGIMHVIVAPDRSAA